MTSVIDLHRRAIDLFTRRVHAVGAAQWSNATPCTDWDVRALVNHLTVEQLWVPELLAGRTIDDVGDRFDGDQLGDDPVATWRRAADEALAAFASGWAQQKRVRLSHGEVETMAYCGEMTMDAVIHAWDLSRAIGADDVLDADLVTFALRTVEPHQNALAASGLFQPPLPVPAGADDQTRLLALVGRAR